MKLGDTVWVKGTVIEQRERLGEATQYMVQVEGEPLYNKVLVKEDQVREDLSEQDGA